MKLLKLYVFLLCATKLCRTGIVEYYYNGHSFLMNMAYDSQEQPGLHRIHRRQDDSDLLCSNIVHDELCTNGQAQDYVDVYQNCNISQASSVAQIFEELCTPNSRGGYCPFRSTLQLGDICDTTNFNCSSECRDFLMRTRSELGCCIASIYNDSATAALYNYTLWSSCKIEPVTQECPPSTVTLTQNQVDLMSCDNLATAAQLLYSRLCRLQYRDSILNRLYSTAGCQNFTSYDTEFPYCKSNRFGTYCNAIRLIIRELYTTASESCVNNSTCDPLCIQALNNITSTVGCCFNDQYNQTDDADTIDWLSFEFWSMCHLESPGLCELRFVDAIIQGKKSAYKK